MADIEVLRQAQEHLERAGLRRSARQVGGEIRRLTEKSERERAVLASYEAAENVYEWFGLTLDTLDLNTAHGRWLAAFYDAARGDVDNPPSPPPAPREFERLEHVPRDVEVQNVVGQVHRYSRGGWRYVTRYGHESSHVSMEFANFHAPFTEILPD